MRAAGGQARVPVPSELDLFAVLGVLAGAGLHVVEQRVPPREQLRRGGRRGSRSDCCNRGGRCRRGGSHVGSLFADSLQDVPLDRLPRHPPVVDALLLFRRGGAVPVVRHLQHDLEGDVVRAVARKAVLLVGVRDR